MRRWTATIEIDGAVFDAPLANADLQAEQRKAAGAYGALLCTEFGAEDAWITLYKTTQAGTRKDLQGSLYRHPRTGRWVIQ